MSHFTVLVVGENPEKQLAPFHEFECTGNDDEFVQDISLFEKKKKEYETDEESRVRDSEGNLYEPWDEMFYREPITDEEKKVGIGTGFGRGISYTSRDWKDGKGYRPKIHFIPEGMVEVKVPTKELKSFRDFVCEDSEGRVLLPGETPDLSDTHKYGYVRVDEKGEVVDIIDRTNPNSKWDWYVIGGRWGGFFQLKEEGEKADQAYKHEIDFTSMREEKAKEASARYDRFSRLLGVEVMPKLEHSWKELIESEEFKNPGIDEKRKLYHEQYPLSKISELRSNETLDQEDKDFLIWVEYENYDGKTKDEYVDAAYKSAISTFAVIIDGKWYERGEMGWWAAVSNEKEQEAWDNEFMKLLDSASDDTLLTLVDCHT